MGGSGKFSVSSREVEELQRELAARMEQQRQDGDINAYLRQSLIAANERDPVLVNSRLDDIQGILGEGVDEFDRLLFGGSIAKHTYVEGLSDVDSLVVLRRDLVGDRTPGELRRDFARLLRDGLPEGEVADVSVGRLAVTVKYRDGAEVQLLPAVDHGDTIAISSSSGEGWRERIRPDAFTQRLTKVNRDNGGMVIPVVKLAKQVIASQLPGDLKPSGYHTESLAAEAFADYSGPRTPKAMVEHFFEWSSNRVLRPMPDPTGQSRVVDESLDESGSTSRSDLSQRLKDVSVRMRGSRSTAQWSRFFDA